MLAAGTIDFNLTGIPEPVQNAADCSIDQLPSEDMGEKEGGMDLATTKTHKYSSDITLIDLLHKKMVKGWWAALFTYEDGETELAEYLTHVSFSQTYLGEVGAGD